MVLKTYKRDGVCVKHWNKEHVITNSGTLEIRVPWIYGKQGHTVMPKEKTPNKIPSNKDGEQIPLIIAPVLKKPRLNVNSQNFCCCILPAYYPPSNTKSGCASLSSSKDLAFGDFEKQAAALKKNHLIPC